MLPIYPFIEYIGERIVFLAGYSFIVDIAEHLLMEYIVKFLLLEDIHRNKSTNGYIAEYPFTGYIVRNGAAT
jgi:hypothetical protein